MSVLCLAFCFITAMSRAEGVGADAAAPVVAARLAKLPIRAGSVYVLEGQEAHDFVALAAETRINAFELIDCAYRYLAPRQLRIRISGETLRKADVEFDLGKERVRTLLPIESMTSLEIGAAYEPGEAAMDVRLVERSSAATDFGTAILETRFGFHTLAPKAFDEPFGISVRRFLFSSDLSRVELYAAGKAAFYVSGLWKPKRWNIWIVRKR